MSTETGSKRPTPTIELPKRTVTGAGAKPMLSAAKIDRLRKGRVKPVRFALASVAGNLRVSNTGNLPVSDTSGLEQPSPDVPLVLPPVGTVVDWAEITECYAVFNPNVDNQAEVIITAHGYIRDHYLDVKLEASWIENSCLDDAGMPCGALVVEVLEAVVGTPMNVTREFKTTIAVASPQGFGSQEAYIVFCGWEAGTLSTPPPKKTMKRVRVTL